jgi:hypothetical protein
LRLDAIALDAIQAPKTEPQIMRYKPSDFEWTAIMPMLPNCLAGALWPDLQRSMVLVLLVTIASSGGSRLASGTRSWMRLLAPMTGGADD